MQPSIFIASSKEGKKYANLVKNEIQAHVNITLWFDNFFELNSSTLDCLCKKAIMYDFAIVLYTKDDISVSRKKVFSTPRDNIIFEHGLFTGLLGRYKTYALIEEGVKVPSDLSGITYGYFSNISSIRVRCLEIVQAIKKELEVSRLSLLPSTSIALAYFQNFLKPICEAIYTKKVVQCCGKHIPFDVSKSKVKVVLPKKLEENLTSLVQQLKNDLSLKNISIQGVNRKYTTYIQKLNEDDYNIIDVPTNLSAVYQSIKLYLAVDYIGDSEEVKLCMNREINNFNTALKLLLNTNNITKELVDIIQIEKLPLTV